MSGHSYRWLGTRMGLACAALVAAAMVAPDSQAQQVWTKSYTVSGRPQVVVNTNDGGVRISTGDTKQVDLRVEYEGYEIDKNLHIESSQSGDRVELTARAASSWGIFWGHVRRRLHLEVRMPKDGDLEVDTGDGAVELAAVNGNINIRTGDGSVRANTLMGTISLHTNDGSITVDSLKGDIRLHSGDGHIDATNLDGKVDADSGDGHIQLDGRFDGLNVRTGDGSVQARALPGSKMMSSWSLRTGDGSVDLTLPSEFQADIDASTGDGHISLGIPVTVEGTFSNSKIHGKMNGGGQPLTIHTGDGSIRLSKA